MRRPIRYEWRSNSAHATSNTCLNLVQIDLAGKKWDDATTLLERLKNSLNPEIAQAARKSLADLPTLKKYGVLPQPESHPVTAATALQTSPQDPASAFRLTTPRRGFRLRSKRCGPDGAGSGQAQSPVPER